MTLMFILEREREYEDENCKNVRIEDVLRVRINYKKKIIKKK